MFFHEFGEDFVLALELLFQQGDPPVLAVAGGYGSALTESSFAGSTTNAPIVIAVIATAASPSVARGVDGS